MKVQNSKPTGFFFFWDNSNHNLLHHKRGKEEIHFQSFQFNKSAQDVLCTIPSQVKHTSTMWYKQMN